MKRHLADLTMGQYVEMLCNPTSLLDKREYVSAERLYKVRRNIMFEYASIADAASAKSSMSKSSKIANEKSRLKLFGICLRLIAIEAEPEARSVLDEYGLKVTRYDTTEKLIRELKQQMLRSSANIKRMERDEPKEDEMAPAEIRRHYDEQAAALMTYFKFQIDLNTIKATSYAYMIAQATRQIKATNSMMNKR